MPNEVTAPKVPKPSQAGPTALRTVNELARVKGVTLLLMSDPGVGKTTMLRRLPAERTVVYDVDGGFDVLSGVGFDGSPPWNGAIVQAPEDLANLKSFVEWACHGLHADMYGDRSKYTTIVIDSISHLERRMVFLMAEFRKRELPSIQEYGDAGVKMRQYLFALKDIAHQGTNVIFISHTKSDVKGAEGERFPALSDKLAREVLGFVDMVGYMGVNPDGSRYLQFAPTPGIRAKTRYSVVQPYENGLDLADIFGRILGARRTESATGKPKAKGE